MISKLQGILERYEKLTELVSDPAVLARMDEWRKYTKERADMEETVEKFKEYKKIEQDKLGAEELYKVETDPVMKEMLEEEIYDCKRRMEGVVEELKILLIPKDPNDDKNVILEIRAGAGGEEAALFAYELYRMYVKYAERNRWRAEEIDSNSTELGGIKEVTFSVSGKGVYSKLKFESGVHRVQRVPETESQGRVHTSTATVAVLPEPEDVDVQIEEKDLIIETCRSSGAGGQHINKTESCIRMVHIPTGIVVNCQDERSQTKNREKAMKVMKSRVFDYYNTKYQNEYSENRRAQVGTGDRSERIRTYNFPQGRVSDHRINKTMYNLDEFIMGYIDEMTEALQIADREAKLSGENND
ncbi:MAG: peptide chain release factor 1 [Clostridia bacterium]|nr:peptide chain release factor 1 [Clostridia bacterium]MBR6688077.1 peptide chain release factor 1 [Clostridia bacterium]